MLHLICALNCEAAPLISAYKLTHNKNISTFKSYSSTDQSIQLTVSGVGKEKISHAVERIATHFESQNDFWLNIGIAGHKTKNIGELCLAHSISDPVTGEKWYPQIINHTGIDSADLVTLEQPSIEYSTSLYDMEAAGFYSQVLKYSTLERAQCLKIISDNEKQAAGEFNKAEISRLIAGNMEKIQTFITTLMRLARPVNETQLHEWQTRLYEHCHFSDYQRRRLKKILNRWQCVLTDKTPLELISKGSIDANSLMESLESKLDASEITFHA